MIVKPFLHTPAATLALATALVLATPLHAQLAGAPTPGDRVVHTIGSGATLGSDGVSNLGVSMVHDFDAAGTVLPDLADSFDLGADGGPDDTKLFLTSGHHLVLYGIEFDSVEDRAGIESFLRINGTETPYGASGGYARDATNDKLYSRGGTILEVAQGDSIEIETVRTDNEPRAITRLGADLQVVALDEAWTDFLRLGVTTSTEIMPAGVSDPLNLLYETEDEVDGASFAHGTGAGTSEITLKHSGHYLVLANTGFNVIGGSSERNVLTQEIFLNGAPVPGGATAAYMRHSGATDTLGGLIDDGTASIGVLIEVTDPDSVLEVRVSRDNVGSSSTVWLDPQRTALAIARLPKFGDYITLEGGPQPVNVTPATPLDFSASSGTSTDSFVFAPGTSASQVALAEAADYLFLSAHHGMADAAGSGSRSIVRHALQVTPSGGAAAPLGFGYGGAYNRDQHNNTDQARMSGGWTAGIMALGAGDVVEATTEQVGGGGGGAQVTTDSLGFQGMNLVRMSAPPTTPFVLENNPRSVTVNDSAFVITAADLRTIDGDHSAAQLTYTVDGSPVNGTLRLSAAPLGSGSTFTQDDIDNDLLDWLPGPTANAASGFSFTVRDPDLNAVSADYGANTVQMIVVGNDSGAVGEDSTASEADLSSGANLLANDTGDGLTVTSFDAVSAGGAAVVVNADGTFTYDPTVSQPLQGGGLGDTTPDTFGYTVTDAIGKTAAGTVTMNVGGANDQSVANDDSVTVVEDSPGGGDVLTNDSDLDTGETATLTVSMVDGDPGKVGVAITTVGGGTITLNPDGSFTYLTGPPQQAIAPGEAGYDYVTYKCRDVHGLESATDGILTLQIAGTDDGVIAYPNTYAIDNDEIATGDFILDDTGEGADASIDASEFLSLQAVDTSGTLGSLTITQPDVIGNRGTISVTDAVQTVNFGIPGMTNPVVIAGPPSRNETEPTVVRVTNVNAAAGTFDIQLVEQPETGVANDGDGPVHAAETVSWMVIEAGRYVLPNGAPLEAGLVNTSAIQHDGPGGSSWATVSFAGGYAAPPAVFHTIQTLNGTPAENAELFNTRVRSLSSISFEVALEDWEGDSEARTAAETIGWVAIGTGSGFLNGQPFDVMATPDAVTHSAYPISFTFDNGTAPELFASMTTFDGSDPSHVRRQNVTGATGEILIGEDTMNDTEISHTSEIVHYMAIGGSGPMVAYPIGAQLGSFSYEPPSSFDTLDAGESATDTFSYTITDSSGNTSSATVTIVVTGSGADTDGDGLPDKYEIDNGLNPNDPNDALTDPDGDGTTATQEYLFGTLENNAASVFRIRVSSVDKLAGTVGITIGPVFEGFSYQIANTTDLGIYSITEEFTATADSAEVLIEDVTLLNFEAYRALALRPSGTGVIAP
ncbi:agglutinin biogenesis protein MshQ [Haloferula helveola]|uniref:Agglutinin biogenesis protein MshQ n=1 Tax=Haloferula helveola TaxID=490095 RepID=A0ABN6H342_9BACT|nr:agglutinin biogenesis protein MshQ [Haloferula helveola]